jgi:hypothetical protein
MGVIRHSSRLVGRPLNIMRRYSLLVCFCLLPHRIDAHAGSHWPGSRGASVVMSSAFALTREYPHAVRGPADVYSGRFTFGLTAVPSGASRASARVNGVFGD